MAYAAIVSFKLSLEQILLHPHRYYIPCDNQQIQSLHEKLEFLQEFFENLSHKRDETTTCLEGRIVDAVYESEDFIDLLQTNQFKNFASRRVKLMNILRRIAYASDGHLQHMTLWKLSVLQECDFQNLLQIIDSIAEEAANMKELLGFEIDEDGEIPPWNSSGAGSSRLGSSSNVPVVFDEHLIKIKESIKDQLVGQPSRLKVLSLVGMGGIGKTSLATNIYTDSSIVYHFYVRSWATVSQSYSIRGILLGILGSMNKLTDDMYEHNGDQLRRHIYTNLKGQRYLIIIDDIWDTSVWDSVKMVFPNDNNGSRIVLTTRLRDVAVYAGSSDPHHMPLLSPDQSWSLLCAKVFGGSSCPFELREIGMKIARCCQGLPLSVVVISGLLSNVKMTQEAWENVAKNVNLKVASSSHDQCLGILKLCYNYLPHRLKACILYMGGLPEDSEILASRITKIWVAEGFLKQDEVRSFEEVAESCLEELADRSLILPAKRNFERKIKTFKIHNLLGVFCLKEAYTEKFLHVTQRYATALQYLSHCLRRIFFYPTEALDQHLFDSIPENSYARSLIVMGKHNLPSFLFAKYELLRVLDVNSVEFIQFPLEIFELLNLRYIAFKYKGSIPASISKLWNLQTLIIHQVYRLFERKIEAWLPVEIWNMPHLRHLKFLQINYLDPTDASSGSDGNQSVLENLQTLSGIRNLRFTQDMLKRIPNVKELEITYDPLSWEKGLPYYHLENLVHLHQLEVLEISVYAFPIKNILNSEVKFSFPLKLKKLSLTGCEIPWKDLSIVGSLPNLEVLKLRIGACRGTEWEVDEEEFCKLKLLSLEELKLVHWRADSVHFPRLERLVLRDCKDLEEIPSAFGGSCTLMKIEMDILSASALASAQEILETQQSFGNDGFQLVINEWRNVYFNFSPMKQKHWNLI